jgi:post-segregation antitoxin (ccd killing protein)
MSIKEHRNSLLRKTKKNVMIRIDQDVVLKAKEMGLNLSKVAENAFISSMEAMEQAYI